MKLIREEDNCLVYTITDKGKQKIKKLAFEELRIGQPKDWDEKWRLVLFDIPESRKKERGALRNKLKDLGFYQCQKSAWIHPFPCFEEIEFLKNVINIEPFVETFLIEEMTDDKVLFHFRDLLKKTVLG